MTKEDMKQISDLMDEKFIASEGRMRAEIVASEARTGETENRVRAGGRMGKSGGPA